ncbi:MAG: alpha-1,2-fucosyltransferase, partial [Muribaculaceae bacterium]|nr:alpha-1,2-fucosyltransferase [Muribaculaceae bacterium]
MSAPLHRRPLLRRFLAALARPLAALLHSSGLMHPQIYVRVDGGLASQIHFYLVGEEMRRRTGAEVEYDLSWFDENGMDLDGRFVRNFDLLRFSPGLPFNRASNRWKLSLYRLLYKHINDYDAPPEDWRALRPPLYMDGYYADPPGFYSDMRNLFSVRPAGLDAATMVLEQEILTAPDATGIHVRRGDLSKEVYSYGKPASDLYFCRAVSLMQRRHGKEAPFYIFSDEPEWVRQQLLPRLPEGNYHVIDANGSDRGYVDLWLLSRCRHFITSKGSFGRFAAMLSSRTADMIIPDDPESRRWLPH